jgi:hypothetical protein
MAFEKLAVSVYRDSFSVSRNKWVEIRFAHRVTDPVEHSGNDLPVVDERRDVGVGVGHAWVDLGIQVEVHPIGGQHYPESAIVASVPVMRR